MLTLQEAFDHITHALGGDPDNRVALLRIVNGAGGWLTAHRSWHWMSRHTADVYLVAGQDYVDLPSDYAEFRGITSSSLAGWPSVQKVDYGEFQAFRELSNAFGDSGSYRVANFHDVADFGLALPTPRFAITPSPSVDSIAAFTNPAFQLEYRAKWKEQTNADTAKASYLPLPSDQNIETLFLQIVRAFAKGYEKDSEAELDQRLAVIAAGPLMRDAIDAEMRSNHDSLHLRNTALDQARGSDSRIRRDMIVTALIVPQYILPSP